MAIYRLPPSPFVGGRQPLEPRHLIPSEEEFRPKFSIPILTAILIAWQPLYIPVQRQVRTPQEFVEPEKVPYSKPQLSINIRDYRLPQLQRKFVHAEVVTEQVPFKRYQPSINWRDIDYSIQLPPKIAQEVVVSDRVPYVRPQLFVTIEYSLPQIQSKLAQEFVAAEEKVPFTSKQPVQYPEIWTKPQIASKLVPIVEEKVPFVRRPITYPEIWIRPQVSPKYIPEAVVVEKVPFKSRLPVWYEAALIPQLQRKLNPSILHVVVDDPPFNSRSPLSAVIAWNYPPNPVIQKYNKSIFEVRVDDPPFNSRIDPSIAISWIASDITRQRPNRLVPTVEEKVPYKRYQPNYEEVRYRPQLPVKLAQSFVQVDNPPFGKRDWLTAVLATWTILLEPPRPVLNGQKYTPEFVAPTVNDPPFGRRVLWLNTVMDAWIPPPPTPWNPIIGFTPPTSADIIIWMWKRVL